MTSRRRIWVGRAGAHIAVSRWGDVDPTKPTALLVHGTSFVAEVWDEVASMLAPTYTVYALDRRGHGDSHKPTVDRYHFLDFALDLRAVVQALDLSGIFGIGHSAGATDLLLAAKLLPQRFSRLFVMEPTVMDPRVSQIGHAVLSHSAMTVVRRVLRRQIQFESAGAAFQSHRTTLPFANWSEESLWAYIRHGFESMESGGIRLLCQPEIQAAMLLPILEAMEQVYVGDERGNPFHWLSEIDCSVRIATAERSDGIYKEMAKRAAGLIPVISHWTFDGVGHCVAQEAPALLLQALQAFDVRTS